MTLFQDTAIPIEIIHLDFDPDTTVEEELEQPKMCELVVRKDDCPNTANWLVSVQLSGLCGHRCQLYVCDNCWSTVQRDPNTTWMCWSGCDTLFTVMMHLTGLERIK